MPGVRQPHGRREPVRELPARTPRRWSTGGDCASARRTMLRELDADFDAGHAGAASSASRRNTSCRSRARWRSDARVLILDEPTASLSHRECVDLFRIVRRLRDAGRALLFISHKFEEIFEIADRYAVFRDGVSVGAGMLADTDREQLIRLMVGRVGRAAVSEAANRRIGEELLRVENLVARARVRGHFLLAAPRRDPRHLWTGRRRPHGARAGPVRPDGAGSRAIRDGKPVRSQSAMQPASRCVPEDRQSQGAILPFSIAANVALPNLARARAARLVRRRARSRRSRAVDRQARASRRTGPRADRAATCRAATSRKW